MFGVFWRVGREEGCKVGNFSWFCASGGVPWDLEIVPIATFYCEYEVREELISSDLET